MRNALDINFLISFLLEHNAISMANANIGALYTASLRVKTSYFFLEYFFHFTSGA